MVRVLRNFNANKMPTENKSCAMMGLCHDANSGCDCSMRDTATVIAARRSYRVVPRLPSEITESRPPSVMFAATQYHTYVSCKSKKLARGRNEMGKYGGVSGSGVPSYRSGIGIPSHIGVPSYFIEDYTNR